MNSVMLQAPKRNYFDLSHKSAHTNGMGFLAPTAFYECVPSGSYSIGTSTVARVAPMVAPAFVDIDIYKHNWFIPNRILWSDWETFITGSRKGKVLPEADIPVKPYFLITSGFTPGTLGDYLGLPPVITEDTKIDAMIVASYVMTWNEWYRDQNLQDEIEFDLVAGNNNVANLTLLNMLYDPPLKRAWGYDYFTSALPWPQKGDPVTLPLGTRADLVWEANNNATLFRDPANGHTISTGDPDFTAGTPPPAPSGALLSSSGDTPAIPASADVTSHTYVDLTTALAATVNSVRRAFAVQRWLEKAARGGTRYIEQNRAIFGVQGSDARLQRPEYIIGHKSPVSVSAVTQTSSTDGTSPQGNLAGQAISVGRSGSSRYTCEEHGIILELESIMPQTLYYQGIDKIWQREDRYEYLQPDLADIGEEAIYTKELWSEADKETVFGYTPRYSRYRFMPNRVHGEFRPGQSLEQYTLARQFATEPSLSPEFIECDPSQRIFAVTDEPQSTFWIQTWHECGAMLPLPKYGTPI